MLGMERVSRRSVGVMRSKYMQFEYCVLRLLGEASS
jgi:hypothetical protein